MSKAKFAAAKEMIDEKDYVGARAVLRTIDHPTARTWEEKLDRIAPSYNYPNPMSQPAPISRPDDEATQYFRAQNRKRTRRRLGAGIELIMGGIFFGGIGIYLLSLPKMVIAGSPPPDNGLALVFIAGGVISALAGVVKIRSRHTV